MKLFHTVFLVIVLPALLFQEIRYLMSCRHKNGFLIFENRDGKSLNFFNFNSLSKIIIKFLHIFYSFFVYILDIF
ncbi:unnamed protein product [Meloidogyne enterolobii]|uniref:Uncharacterized protein n=1 Tax=Meloidogyne enterolobii TaxID=390850 RepID=A0ACB0Y386_MELEN